MYKKNDYVYHKKNGMLVVDEIKTMDFGLGLSQYYSLKQVYASTTSNILIPTDNTNLLRDPISKKTAEDLLKKIDFLEDLWIVDNKQRKEQFNSIFLEGDIYKIASIAKTVHTKKLELIKIKKNLPISDSRAFEMASRLIKEELAYALRKPYNEIDEFIKSKLGE